jgi:hypothetical protein
MALTTIGIIRCLALGRASDEIDLSRALEKAWESLDSTHSFVIEQAIWDAWTEVQNERDKKLGVQAPLEDTDGTWDIDEQLLNQLFRNLCITLGVCFGSSDPYDLRNVFIARGWAPARPKVLGYCSWCGNEITHRGIKCDICGLVIGYFDDEETTLAVAKAQARGLLKRVITFRCSTCSSLIIQSYRYCRGCGEQQKPNKVNMPRQKRHFIRRKTLR